MGSLTPLARASQHVQTPRTVLPASPCQFALVLDDVRLQHMTAAQRQAVLKTMAQLLLEASGALTVEVGDDNT
ncbi:MAG: hypothetical protein P8Y47_04995 [Alphaproteobacteria bacterium]|jgi:hypothetical protein